MQRPGVVTLSCDDGFQHVGLTLFAQCALIAPKRGFCLYFFLLSYSPKGVSIYTPSVTYTERLRIEYARMLQNEKYFNRPASTVSRSMIQLT